MSRQAVNPQSCSSASRTRSAGSHSLARTPRCRLMLFITDEVFLHRGAWRPHNRLADYGKFKIEHHGKLFDLSQLMPNAQSAMVGRAFHRPAINELSRI